MEAAEFMDLVKSGRQHMLPPGDEQIGASVAELCAVRASHADLKLFNYEKAIQVDPVVGKWTRLAQRAAAGSHPYVIEDGPELPKIPGPHTDEGGEVLEGMYTDGCTSLRDTRIISGRAGGQVLLYFSKH
jgi:hypothetical protein